MVDLDNTHGKNSDHTAKKQTKDKFCNVHFLPLSHSRVTHSLHGGAGVTVNVKCDLYRGVVEDF